MSTYCILASVAAPLASWWQKQRGVLDDLGQSYTLDAYVHGGGNSMASTVLSVRVPEELKEQLEYLSRSTKRSKAYLATEALGDYVKKNAWRAKELHEAMKEADKGVFVSHEAMLAWADSLGTDNEIAPPKPDIPRKKVL
jgi:RHH-type rel operon transcriptional repressor/antitoxin RelB